MSQLEPLLNELSVSGRTAISLPDLGAPCATKMPESMVRAPADLNLPELDQLSVVRHFTRLSRLNFAIDTQFYPLGSCTMKYNPKINDAMAALDGFSQTHPLLPDDQVQGAIELLAHLQAAIAKLSGFASVSVQAAAGAQGELVGVLMIRKWHESRADSQRTRMLIPDSAHGTNPATCTMAGYETVSIPSDADGGVDIEALRRACDARTAGIMLTNPSTLGLFEQHIQQIAEIVHGVGGLVYGDGANMNAITGIVRPADLGIDVMHFNLHKTFSTPHGGGGPGACAVGAAASLQAFLPGPLAQAPNTDNPLWHWSTPQNSIGQIKAFHGNFGILVRAYTYIRMLGATGLRALAEGAVLNANYLRVLVKDHYPIPFDRICMHEFVAQPPSGDHVHTIDIAKRLIDYGFHPPTIYFPLIVSEAMMFEPTETESRQTIEDFARALIAIAREIEDAPELLTGAPHNTQIGRLDEVSAARKPVLCWC